MVTLYGIKNCDTVKKARKWLDNQGIDYHFHDFRADGLTSSQVDQWITALGWETLVNKRSTTWKQLDSQQRESMDSRSAAQTILEQPTLIKRPLLDTGKAISVGFNKAQFNTLL